MKKKMLLVFPVILGIYLLLGTLTLWGEDCPIKNKSLDNYILAEELPYTLVRYAYHEEDFIVEASSITDKGNIVVLTQKDTKEVTNYILDSGRRHVATVIPGTTDTLTVEVLQFENESYYLEASKIKSGQPTVLEKEDKKRLEYLLQAENQLAYLKDRNFKAPIIDNKLKLRLQREIEEIKDYMTNTHGFFRFEIRL